LGAAARRKGFGFSRPAAFGGSLCGLPKAMLANQRFTLGESRNPVFYYWHNAPTNAPRSPVCRSVSISDNLSRSNSDGTNRLQCRQGQHKYHHLVSACRHGCIQAVPTFLTGSTAEGEDTSVLLSLSSRSSPKYCACIFRIPLLRFISNNTSCSRSRCALCKIFLETTFGIYCFFVC